MAFLGSLKRHPWRTGSGAAAVVIICLILVLLAYTGVLGTNLREVSPEKFYRSGDMSAEKLGRLIQDHGLKCVINLQASPGIERLQAHMRVCKEAGIEHDYIPFSSTRLPSPTIAGRLVERFEEGPYPMLVHCSTGADRAGLASALYLMVVEDQPLEKATSQLSWRFGHVPFGTAHPMDRFFELYEETADGIDIGTWVRKTYPEVHRK